MSIYTTSPVGDVQLTASPSNHPSGKGKKGKNPKNKGGAPGPPTSGLIVQLDSTDVTSIYTDIAKTTNPTDGQDVAVWADLSGAGNDFVQSTALDQPSYNDGTHIEGFSSVEAYNTGNSSLQEWLVGPDFSSLTALTFIAYLRVNGASRGGIWGTTGISHNGTAAHWNYDLNGTKTMFFGADTGGQGNAHTAWAAGGLPDWDDAMVYQDSMDTDGTHTAYANNIEMFNTDKGGPSFRAAGCILGGCIRAGAPQYGAHTYFHRFLAYDKVLSAGERARAITWLMAN